MNELATYSLEPLYISNRHLLSTQGNAVLNEGLKETVVDAAQFIIAALTEYGLVATVGGAPAGPVIETIVDAGFMAESVASAMATINDVVSLFGELKAIVQQIFSLSLTGGFDAFYEQVKDVWQSIGEILPDAAEEQIEKYIEKAKDIVLEIVVKISDFVSDAVKLVVPDAIIGTAAGEGLQKLLIKIADNAYSVMTSGIELLGQFQRVVTDPAYAVGLFNTIFDGIEELMTKVQARMDEEPEGIAGIIDTVSKIAQPTKIIQDAIAEKALEAFRDFIADKRPVIIALVDKISRIMFPVIFGLLASYQILMKGEWKVEDDEKAALPGTSDVDKLLAAGTSRSLLRLSEATGGGIGVPQQVGYGKNYHTANPDPITWENLDGPEYFVTSQADGSVLAAVSLPGTNLSTPTYEFGDEASAMSWVRNTFDSFRRKSMAQEAALR